MEFVDGKIAAIFLPDEPTTTLAFFSTDLLRQRGTGYDNIRHRKPTIASLFLFRKLSLPFQSF